MESVVDWSELLPELVNRIARCLELPEDLLAFRGVCTSWRAAAAKTVSKVPLLMLSEKDGINSNEREFYSLSKRKICTRIPVPGPKRCTDVGFGWILTLGTKGRVCLVNPFSSARIELPKFTTFPGYCSESSTNPKFFFITRGVLTANPSETLNFMLYVAASPSLGVWKNGDEKWTSMDSHSRHMVYCNGKMYSPVFLPGSWSTGIGIWDPQATDLSKPQGIVRVHNALESIEDLSNDYYYLVESTGGELLYISRNRTSYHHNAGTDYFRVKRIDLVEGECKEIDDLGKDAIFVGDNAAVSVDATEFPGILKPNCIYFTDDRFETYSHSKWCPKGGGKDMGIYNVEDGSIERFGVKSFSRFSPPLWIFPSF